VTFTTTARVEMFCLTPIFTHAVHKDKKFLTFGFSKSLPREDKFPYMANFRNFGPPNGLKLSCDYMTNFCPGKMYKIGREKFAGKRFTFTTQAHAQVHISVQAEI